MKYIRTKDGYVLKISKKQKRPNGEYDTWYSCKNGSLLYNHDKDKITKESDTIEELCDTFVIWDSGNNELLTFIRYTNIHFKHFVENAKRKVVKIYGAIWTDKGLIYVAKMNDKGELELL